MRTMLLIGLAFVLMIILMGYCDSKRDPYEQGMHMDYSIQCEGGFTYKILGNRRGTILILNSDGTPLKCGHKRY